MQSDIRQAVVWNTLGLILLKTGRLQVHYVVLRVQSFVFFTFCGLMLTLLFF